MKISCTEILFLEMTILEELNMGNLEKAIQYTTKDFKGLTFDGVAFKASLEYSDIISKQHIIVTEETFDYAHINDTTMKVTYLAYSEYAKDILKHSSIWKLIDGKLLMSEHWAEATELKY